MTGKRSDPWNLDPGDDVLNLFVADRSGAGSDDEAGQPFRMRGRVVERDESAAGDADEVKSSEREMVGECVKIVRGTDQAEDRSPRRSRYGPSPCDRRR